MGFLSRLFSSPDAIADTVKSATRGLDDLVYTDQERDERTQLAQEIYKEMWLAAVPSALSRRLIACAFVFTYCLMCLAGVAFFAFSMDNVAEFSFRVLKEVLLWPVNAIVGFYFLKQVVSTYRKGE